MINYADCSVMFRIDRKIAPSYLFPAPTAASDRQQGDSTSFLGVTQRRLTNGRRSSYLDTHSPRVPKSPFHLMIPAEIAVFQ